MSPVVLGVPYVPPAPPASPFRGLVQKWTGWDGSVWEVSNPAGGVFFEADGVVGLGDGPADRFFSTSPAVAGSRFRGSRNLERPVVWQVGVFSDVSSQAWIDLTRAFRNTLHRQRPGVWMVTQPSGESRTLACRFTDSPDSLGVDPVRLGWGSWTVNLVAEDPYWQGAPIRRTFAASEPADFFPEGGGPPFTISEGSTLASATINNPGDVDAWPVWTVNGPTTAVSLGVGDASIGIPGDLDEGDVLVIDTDPRRQSATLNGARVRGVLSPHDFAPIPAGGMSDLTLTIVGDGSVECVIVPRYERAW